MKRIENILRKISLEELVSDYKNGICFSEKANNAINKENVTCEIVEYHNHFEINFYENDDELIITYKEYK